MLILPKADEIRAGIVHHFPRMLGNPQAAAQRAQQGRAGRERQRHDRERRRGRRVARGGSGRRAVTPEIPEQQEDEEPLEWPASDEDQAAPQEEDEHAIAARLEWENEERFRQGNYNVAPRSNGVVLRLRPSRNSQTAGGSTEVRLRGGGEGGEVVEVLREDVKAKNVFDVGDQELVIETM